VISLEAMNAKIQTLNPELGVPLSLVGGIWYMVWLDYNMSIAVWVGIIALAGVAAATSAVMLAYLDEACKRRKATGELTTLEDLIQTV
jgi:Cu(I)/Ag(I) efflux system membrane protein CusA/SilA